MSSLNTPDFKAREDLSLIELIRKRPGMYIGSTDFAGFADYLVCPVSLLLASRPSWIEVTVTDTGFMVESDATIVINETTDGLIEPFEGKGDRGFGLGFEASLLTALSVSFEVRASASGKVRELSYQSGRRVSQKTRESDETSTCLSFTPDTSIFSVTTISPTFFESYLWGQSFLHRGVRFRLIVSGQTQEFCSLRGIRDLFECVAASYQLLQEPIHIMAEDGELHLELIFACQSQSDDPIWSFVNNSKALNGGTHEEGLQLAFRKIWTKLKHPRNCGILAVMSISYPGAIWEGCTREKVGNTELKTMISQLVVKEVMAWFDTHPEVAQQAQHLRAFRFLDVRK